MMKVSASLVLYNNNPDQYGRAIRDFLEGCDGTLIVIDNSPEPLQHPLFQDPRVQYQFMDANLGFGRGHNRALSLLNGTSDFHLFLNPDILFDRYVRGATLAESFYAASYMVLWKDLVIGDPLCAPYAMFQEPSFAP